MTKNRLRQLRSRVSYLRKIYEEMDDFTKNATTPRGKVLGEKASSYLKCSVALMLDAHETEFGGYKNDQRLITD